MNRFSRTATALAVACALAGGCSRGSSAARLHLAPGPSANTCPGVLSTASGKPSARPQEVPSRGTVPRTVRERSRGKNIVFRRGRP